MSDLVRNPKAKSTTPSTPVSEITATVDKDFEASIDFRYQKSLVTSNFCVKHCRSVPKPANCAEPIDVTSRSFINR
jgi:hypothetical protein